MKKNILQNITRNESFQTKLEKVDDEFKDFLTGLSYKRDFAPEQLKTFSPIDTVEEFEQNGIQALKEVTRDEMLQENQGFNKLLANMLAQCQPGALSDEDLNHITGINGREVHADL
ncbi:MAG: hypothetical protein ABII18_13910 [bacterium]|nr:hypothetical protein [bacterium]